MPATYHDTSIRTTPNRNDQHDRHITTALYPRSSSITNLHRRNARFVPRAAWARPSPAITAMPRNDHIPIADPRTGHRQLSKYHPRSTCTTTNTTFVWMSPNSDSSHCPLPHPSTLPSPLRRNLHKRPLPYILPRRSCLFYTLVTTFTTNGRYRRPLCISLIIICTT